MFILGLVLLASFSVTIVLSYSPAYSAEKWKIGDVFSPEEKMSVMEKAWKRDRLRLAEHAKKVRAEIAPQDIKNAASNGIVLAPKLFNIFRGNTWTTAQKNLVDNMATYVGASPYGAILQTYYNPSGTKPAAIAFVGSAQDSSEAPGQTGVDPSTNDDTVWVINQMQKYVTAKKIAVAGDFDLANFDLSNTIFTLFLASGYNFVTTPSYCGWHNAIPVLYNGVTKQILVSFMIQGANGLAISCNSFGQSMGVGQINTNKVTVGATAPNNDVYLDSAMSAYIHEVYETVTDPLFNGLTSWFDNDDDHYSADAPTFKARGGNNENGDMCAWTFGMNIAQQYLTTNKPSLTPLNNVINANLVLNGVYYLVQQQYVYSPPNSQCALTTANLPTLPPATTTNSLSFFNGYKDSNSYYIVIYFNSYAVQWQKSWISPKASYGQHVEFSKTLPAGTTINNWLVVQAGTNKIVAQKNPSDSDVPFSMDNSNANIIALWGVVSSSGVSGAYVSARFGVSGVSSLPSYVVINAAYTGSSTISITNGLGAAVTPNVAANVNRYYYSSGGQWTAYRYSQGTTGTAGSSVDMSGWKFACGSSSSSINAVVPGSFTIPAGTTAFVICLPTTATAYQTTTAVTTNVFSPTATPTAKPSVVAGSPTMSPNIPTATPTPKPTMIPTTMAPQLATKAPTPVPSPIPTAIPTVVAGAPTFLPTFYTASAPPSLKPTMLTMAPTSEPTGTISPVFKGFLQLLQYTDAACATTPLQQDVQLGLCSQTDTSNSIIYGGYYYSGDIYNPAFTYFSGTTYASSTCIGNTATNTTAGSMVSWIDTTVKCLYVGPGTYITANYVTTLPTLPTGQLAFYQYTNQATCNAGTASGLTTATYYPATCSISAGTPSTGTYQVPLCAASGVVTSTTGGFAILRYYNTPTCSSLPTTTLFYQLNVCGQQANNGSLMIVPQALAKQTIFVQMQYSSNDCSGTPLNTQTGGYYSARINSIGNTSTICAPSNLGDPTVAFYTVMQASTIGNSQGYSTYQYSGGAASCTAATPTKLFSGVTYSTGCLVDASTASQYLSNGGCASTNVGATLAVNQVMSGVTVAQAQSASFQAKFIAAVANYIGVATSSVSITGVAATTRRLGEITPEESDSSPDLSSTTSSRELQGNRINIAYTVAAANINPTTTTNLLANAGPVVASALVTTIPTIAATAGSGTVAVTGVNTPAPVGAPTTAAAIPPAAAPAATPTSSSSGCFAGSEMVMLSSGVSLSMDEVRVGDRILTINRLGQQVFSDVVYLPHGPNNAPTTFTTLTMESGRDVKMTNNHFLPAGSCDLAVGLASVSLPMVTAGQVKVGDCVHTISGVEQVVAVNKVEGKGIYTVIAMEELIVVNGIVATPYGGVNPTLVNMYYNLHRLMYSFGNMKTILAKNWLQTATEHLWGSLAALSA